MLIGNGEERTEAPAARQLAGWMEELGWEVRIEMIPSQFVHIDVLVSILAPKLAAVCVDVAGAGLVRWLRDAGFEILEVPVAEAFALGVNAISLGDERALSSEYSKTMKMNYGAKTIAIDISGVSPEFGSMRNILPQKGGRFINPNDMAEQRRVLFIGQKMSADVFGEGEDPVGKTVMLGGSPFLIVGILEPKVQNSSYSGRDNQKGFIPGTTFRAITGEKWVDNLIYQAKVVGDTEQVTDDVRRVIAQRQRFDPNDKEAFSVWDTTENLKFFAIFFLSFRLFLGIIGSFTLIVGGIGVSNIMNVVVEERTKEIGIKMALGARDRWLLRQLLLETLLITGLGGALGFAISYAVCAVFPKFGVGEYVGNPDLSLSVASLTAAVLGLTGLIAGYFPARDASRLDPVVAMKL